MKISRLDLTIPQASASPNIPIIFTSPNFDNGKENRAWLLYIIKYMFLYMHLCDAALLLVQRMMLYRTNAVSKTRNYLKIGIFEIQYPNANATA